MELEKYAATLRAQIAQEKQQPAAATHPAVKLPQNLQQAHQFGSDQIRGSVGTASEKLNPLPQTNATAPPQRPLQPIGQAAQPPLVNPQQQQQPPPPQMMLMPTLPIIPPKLTHDVNYCDRMQFEDEKLAELSLKRADYFIYNTSCSGIFFQCAIGQTFVSG
jgi:hypothetical protein